MSGEDEPKIIRSPLCEKMTVDGRTVEIEIYGTGGNDWILEVVDEEGNSVVWDGTFDTDALAYNTFDEQLHNEGIEAILNSPKAEWPS